MADKEQEMSTAQAIGAGSSGRLWEGKTAIVTGGALGIGAAIAAQGIADGARVWVFDIDDDAGEAVARRLGERCRYRHVDVTDEKAIGEAVAKIVAVDGDIDILVNNACGDASEDAVTMTLDRWDSIMRLNLTSAWLMSRAVLPSMIRAGSGSIVNIGSLHARLTEEGAFPYAAGKAGLGGLTRSLALDYGPKGIRVNMVCPGWTRSERVEAMFERVGPEAVASIEGRHALRRVAVPEDIAPTVSFIASDHASFVTGATWEVDGGLGARFA